jgi:uncharacterized integral membrane protein
MDAVPQRNRPSRIFILKVKPLAQTSASKASMQRIHIGLRRFEMFSDRGQWVRIFAAILLAIVFAVPTNLMAETSHLVSPSDLQKEAVSVSQTRQRNIATVQGFLTGPRAEKAIRSVHADPSQIRAAVASLSDQELAQLANKAANAERDFAAGHLSTVDDILIIGAIVLVIIIVVATR